MKVGIKIGKVKKFGIGWCILHRMAADNAKGGSVRTPPPYGIGLTSFDLEFLSFWISRLFDLGDLSVLQNGTRKHFENGLKSIQIFQRLMEGMNCR